MSDGSGERYQGPIIGSANRGAERDDHEPIPVLVELNVLYPGGLRAVTEAFFEEWSHYREWADAPPPEEQPPGSVVEPAPPAGLMRITPKLYQAVLTRAQISALIEWDRRARPAVIFKIWPDYTLEAQIDRSAPTVKADAGWRSYNARGRGIVWAVLDSGIDGTHPHFQSLEIHAQAKGVPEDWEVAAGVPSRTRDLHQDFSGLVHVKGVAAVDRPRPLTDEMGHGTHVAGIIAGHTPPGAKPHVAVSAEPSGAGYVPRGRVDELSGMAPECELVSLKVLRRNAQGDWVTSSSALIKALTYIRQEVNVDPAVLRIHGVNLSCGCPWEPNDYAAGQSPLCQAVNQLVDSGVVVVVSAGNYGGSADGPAAAASLGSITEPAHAETCIAVGSTHREAPHTFGVTWTSGKGPTLDGRMKPDVVAPGERITSAATGALRRMKGLDALPGPDGLLTYAEQSGTSMAAPHVSGVIAAFLSARPEFIGRPQAVKRLLTEAAVDLGRERYAQGAGLVDLMRMLSNV